MLLEKINHSHKELSIHRPLATIQVKNPASNHFTIHSASTSNNPGQISSQSITSLKEKVHRHKTRQREPPLLPRKPTRLTNKNQNRRDVVPPVQPSLQETAPQHCQTSQKNSRINKKPFPFFSPTHKTKQNLKNQPRKNQKINSQVGAEGLQLEDQKSTKSGYAGSMQTHLPPSHHIKKEEGKRLVA
jgi:hypothetical protein